MVWNRSNIQTISSLRSNIEKLRLFFIFLYMWIFVFVSGNVSHLHWWWILEVSKLETCEVAEVMVRRHLYIDWIYLFSLLLVPYSNVLMASHWFFALSTCNCDLLFMHILHEVRLYFIYNYTFIVGRRSHVLETPSSGSMLWFSTKPHTDTVSTTTEYLEGFIAALSDRITLDCTVQVFLYVWYLFVKLVI